MTLSPATWRVAVDGTEVSAAFDPCPHESAPVFVCAHGAGGNLADRGVVTTARTMREHGLHTVRFNFVYREKKIGRPDPMPRLTTCTEAVVEHTRRELGSRTLIVGGRSMGGRAASVLASEGFDCDGLLLLAYPLHPPKQPEKLRSAHLPAIRQPVLCINGTRDEFCTPSIMTDVLKTVGPNWQMLWIDGADHSFHVLKSSGRTDSAVMQEIGAATSDWVQRRLSR
jgi:predicted alpha/beta-hydrolase family hydrolase